MKICQDRDSAPLVTLLQVVMLRHRTMHPPRNAAKCPAAAHGQRGNRTKPADSGLDKAEAHTHSAVEYWSCLVWISGILRCPEQRLETEKSLRKSQRRGRQRCRKLWAQTENALYLQSRTGAKSCILISVLEMTSCAQEKKLLLQSSVFPSEKRRWVIWLTGKKTKTGRAGILSNQWVLGINGPRLYQDFLELRRERSEPEKRRNEKNTAMLRRSKWQNFSNYSGICVLKTIKGKLERNQW